MEDCLGANLSRVRIHCGPDVTGFTRRLGSPAFARGGEVFLEPGWYAPSTSWGLWLLAHELAHVVQQRGGRTPPQRSRSDEHRQCALEEEANAAAFAVLAGCRANVRSRVGASQPQAAALIPLLQLLAVAVGAYKVYSCMDSADIDRARRRPPGSFSHDTNWVFVPGVGSYSQLRNGRSYFERMAGAAFFIVDMTMVGPAVKGVLFGLKTGAKLALDKLGRLGSRAIGSPAYDCLELAVGNGARLVTTAEAQQIIEQAVRQSGNVLIVGTETGLNHAVAYIVDDCGQVIKLHGGILRVAYAPEVFDLAKATAGSVAKRMNYMSIYPISEAAGLEAIRFWGERSGSNWFKALLRGGLPRGCQNSQILLMEQLANTFAIPGLPAVTGLAGCWPLLPLQFARGFLDAAGNHFVMNQFNALKGTAVQGGALIMPIIVRELGSVYGLADQFNFEEPDIISSLPGGRSLPSINAFYTNNPELRIRSVLCEPGARISLSLQNSMFTLPPSGLKIRVPAPYRVGTEPPPAPWNFGQWSSFAGDPTLWMQIQGLAPDYESSAKGKFWLSPTMKPNRSNFDATFSFQLSGKNYVGTYKMAAGVGWTKITGGTITVTRVGRFNAIVKLSPDPYGRVNWNVRCAY